MPDKQPASPGEILRGAVYGDLVGSPFMKENTHNRYFDLGEGRRAFSRGRVRTFFPVATEASHGAAAVCRWLSTWRDSPSAETLQKCLREQYDSHPRAEWSTPTRVFLTSGMREGSPTSDWAAVARSVPVAAFCGDDLFRALELAEASVKATCSDPEAARMAVAIAHAVHMALHGGTAAEIFTTMDMQYGLVTTRPEEDVRAMLRGEVAEPLVMLGREVEGAYRFREPESPAPPSARTVTEAALRAVLRSDSWEDAVRRAVALGGPSNGVAGIAGAIAAALWGGVAPEVVGKLFAYVPPDVAHVAESLDGWRERNRVGGDASPYSSIARDAVTIIAAEGSKTAFVVPEGRKDLRDAVTRNIPDPLVISPSEVEPYLDTFREERTGTYAYGPRPEIRTLYLQDGRLVSPSSYSAPGMPPLQERRRHLEAFLSLRSWCAGIQGELNAAAGNPGAGQVHYGRAYHMWIGGRRIDFLYGDEVCGTVRLDARGLMRLDLGEYREIPEDARFTGHREASWASRPLFTVPESVDPMGHLDDIREDILSRLLDRGVGLDRRDGADVRGLTDEERTERSGVSNIEHLDPLPPEGPQGVRVKDAGGAVTRVAAYSAPERPQATRTVYTVGYGNRPIEGFLGILGMLGVDTVVDLRASTSSRFTPQFDEEPLLETLSSRGIGYYVASGSLGPRPSDPSLYDRGGQADWKAMRSSPDYRDSLASLEALAGQGRLVAVVSSEADPLTSHRFGTVSRDLAADGFDVRHVLPGGEVVGHAEMEGRLLERCSSRGEIPSVESGLYGEQLEEAYEALGRRFAERLHRRHTKGRLYAKVCHR